MYSEKDYIKKLESVITGVKEGKLQVVEGSINGGVQIGLGQEYNFMVQPISLVEQKKKQKEEALNTLVNYINYDLHDIFRNAIEDDRACKIQSSILRRRTGKTSTLVYLSIQYDLKLIVANSSIASQLKEKYPTLEVYSKDKAFSMDGLFRPAELVLTDETEESTLKSSIGVIQF
ncbi:hypothetical protein LCFBJUUZ_CDS0081 [Staphylococcus phage PG-2021_76]